MLAFKAQKICYRLEFYAQDRRIKSKAPFEAKKAAKKENKLRMTQRNALAKEGEPFINLLIYFSTPFNFFPSCGSLFASC